MSCTVGLGRLHPVTCTWGFFPEEDPELKEKVPGRNPEGGIMTLFSGVVGNWNSSGYGALIQVRSCLLNPNDFKQTESPSLRGFAPQPAPCTVPRMSWQDARQHGRLIAQCDW